MKFTTVAQIVQLLGNPKVLLLDECFAALDVLTIKRLNFDENFDEALFTTRFVLVDIFCVSRYKMHHCTLDSIAVSLLFSFFMPHTSNVQMKS